MFQSFHIFGSGGIGQSAILILDALYPDAEYTVYDIDFSLYDRYMKSIDQSLSEKIRKVIIDLKSKNNLVLSGDFILDCLPGSLAPTVAEIAMNNKLGYINLTEYVKETGAIKERSNNYSESAIILQSGVAPGFVNVLGCSLIKYVKSNHVPSTMINLKMKVGALSKNATAPHNYAFTWSPIGVATEYIMPADVVENHEFKQVPSLSNLESQIINGEQFESSLTSGGIADIAQNYSKDIRNISYQTLRFKGHFDWVKSLINQKNLHNPSDLLEEMEALVPFVEDDRVIIHANLDFQNGTNRLQSIAKSYQVLPSTLKNIHLRAIQISTAVPMVVSIDWAMKTGIKGLVTQSMIDPEFVKNHTLVQTYFEEY
jgi:saccharopine dehydrogenase-like NADP-dependent oxidoreductase